LYAGNRRFLRCFVFSPEFLKAVFIVLLTNKMENLMKCLKLYFCLIFALLMGLPVIGGPTIIRDSRITDTALTPVLGRGYSIGTNTFQSTCMDNVVITEPSYDLSYTFNSIEASSETTSTSTGATSSSANVTTTNSGSSSSSSTSGGWLSTKTKRTSSSQYKNQLNQIYKRAGTSKVTASGTSYSHIIEVNINLITYYASVDEAQTKIGTSAARLLTNRDIPGFFSSCGPYYVRSIGREAVMLSFFEYSSTSTERDMAFENSIENQIKGFRASSGQSTYNRGSTSEKAESSTRTDFDYQYAAKSSYEFNQKASEKNLTITTFAFGIGKREDAKIISYDIDSFKAAIQEAFISMQNPQTGKVVSMEVVPWVENTQFQNLIRLDESEDEYEPVLNAAGEQEMDEDGNPMQRLKPKQLLYEKKMYLNENAEFIIEIDRVDRNIMNMYYKARLCRKNIDMNWKKDGAFREEYLEARVQNKRFLERSIPLTELDSIVSQDRVDQIYQTHKTFMYGAEGDGGASICMKNILKLGIFKISYRDIAECQPIIQNMGEIQNDGIEYYCMPELMP